jgi:hypothetical protein
MQEMLCVETPPSPLPLNPQEERILVSTLFLGGSTEKRAVSLTYARKTARFCSEDLVSLSWSISTVSTRAVSFHSVGTRATQVVKLA